MALHGDWCSGPRMSLSISAPALEWGMEEAGPAAREVGKATHGLVYVVPRTENSRYLSVCVILLHLWDLSCGNRCAMLPPSLKVLSRMV